jgi:hypothetical protein
VQACRRAHEIGISSDAKAPMAMTLRLSDTEAEVLRRRAEPERRSMQEVVRQAIRSMSKAIAVPNCSTRSSMRNCLVTRRRWSVLRSDLPDAA